MPRFVSRSLGSLLLYSHTHGQQCLNNNHGGSCDTCPLLELRWPLNTHVCSNNCTEGKMTQASTQKEARPRHKRGVRSVAGSKALHAARRNFAALYKCVTLKDCQNFRNMTINPFRGRELLIHNNWPPRYTRPQLEQSPTTVSMLLFESSRS